MLKYIVLFILKGLLGATAIAFYQMAPDKKTHDHVQRMIHEMEMEQ